MPLDTAFCTLATSLVMRVTSDETLNLSMLEKENDCNRAYSALRSSAPRPCPARAPSRAPAAPRRNASTALATISAPRL